MPNIGLFGKMPSVGDFVSRGFSPTLCENLDRLLQTALQATTSDGADGREVLAQASPVMVSIRPGGLCASGFAGLWFPSRDRVGRVFPLCVGLETEADQDRMPLFWPTRGLTESLCGAVVQVLQAGGGPDELMAALPPLAEWQVAATRGIPFSDVGDETVPVVSVSGSLFALPGPEDRLSIAARALCSRLPWVVQALGTVVGPNGNPAWYFGSRSMLAWTSFAALFDGRWPHWEWSVDEPSGDDDTLVPPPEVGTA
jgi:type VI secretion system ImpM family protein